MPSENSTIKPKQDEPEWKLERNTGPSKKMTKI